MPLAEPPPRDSRFGSPLKLSRVHWVRPQVVVEVTYLTWTKDNLLRQVSYQGQREDIRWSTCATSRAARCGRPENSWGRIEAWAASYGTGFMEAQRSAALGRKCL
jgi:hypothetical protein